MISFDYCYTTSLFTRLSRTINVIIVIFSLIVIIDKFKISISSKKEDLIVKEMKTGGI